MKVLRRLFDLKFQRGLDQWLTISPFFFRSTTVKYHYLKGNIVGPAYKIPFMGPFLQSVNPKFTEYKAKWDSGELSCVSVFHK